MNPTEGILTLISTSDKKNNTIWITTIQRFGVKYCFFYGNEYFYSAKMYKIYQKLQQRHFIMLQNIFISNKCSFLFFSSRNPGKMYHNLHHYCFDWLLFTTVWLIIIHVPWAANQHIRNISKRSCATEVGVMMLTIQLCITGINSLKLYSNKKLFKICNYITNSQYFFCMIGEPEIHWTPHTCEQ